MLVTVEMRARTIRTLVGSLASSPSGVRLPIASPAIHAPNALANVSCVSLAQVIQARVRQTMRNAPNATTTANHAPTLVMPSTIAPHPPARWTVKISSATPTMATAMFRREKRDRDTACRCYPV
jgi:hypothetical protein